MRKIIKNQAMCKICGDIVESKTTHDFVTCSCGNLSVDGGHNYIRRSAKQPDMWLDMSIEGEEDDLPSMSEQDTSN